MPVTAVTQVGVCNSALIKIGADRISSITENTKSANLLNAIYKQVRDSVLRDHPWNFAIKRASLTPNSTTPTYEYDYTYDLPSDCLRVLDTENDTDEYEIEGRTILTNEESLKLRYIRRADDESEWDNLFAEAMSWRLAREVSYNLTQSSAMVEFCDKGYKRALADARCTDGMEGTIKALVADDWTNARK